MFRVGQEVFVRVERNRCERDNCSTCKTIPKFYEGKAKITRIDSNPTSWGLRLPDGSLEVIADSPAYREKFPFDWIRKI